MNKVETKNVFSQKNGIFAKIYWCLFIFSLHENFIELRKVLCTMLSSLFLNMNRGFTIESSVENKVTCFLQVL
jgi:hypothetical protein